MRPFEIIDHTADVAIAAYGATREELFANAALGMFSIIGDVDKVTPREDREVRVRADDIESLLVMFLSELLYLFEVEHFMLHDAAVETVSDTTGDEPGRVEARATVRGEARSDKHDLNTEIKAVTHHGLKIEKQNNTWQVTVLFDI